MSEKKQYLIDEDALRELLAAAHTLNILERDGVDNWQWYMEGRNEYLAECAAELPWNQGKSHKDLMDFVREEDYDIDTLAQDQIDVFWEPYTYLAAGIGDNVEPYIAG